MHTRIALPLLLVVAIAPAARTDEPDWHTGAAFRTQLALPVAFTWSANPLRKALSNLARDQQVAIFLDRRVDPSQPIDLAVAEGPLEQALLKLAGSLKLGVSYFDPVVYIGPPDVAARLATLAATKRDSVARLAPDTRSRWQRSSAWQWEQLATPRELIERLAAETHCRIVNADAVPHDLWPAAELPKMSATDRLSLLLAGFSLTFEISPDGNSARLVTMPDSLALRRSYRPRGNLREAAQRLQQIFPEITVDRVGLRLQVNASYEDHRLIERWLRGEPIHRTQLLASEKRFSLKIQNTPAGAVINTVARQLQLSVTVAPEVTEMLRQRVSFHVDKVELEELLHAALDPIMLSFQLEDKKLTIEAKP